MGMSLPDLPPAESLDANVASVSSAVGAAQAPLVDGQLPTSADAETGQKKSKTGLFVFIGVAVAAVAIFGLAFAPSRNSVAITVDSTHLIADPAGMKAPVFSGNKLDGSGKASLADYAGKVVVVNFWATWCHPCEKEIPDLSRAYEKYKAKGVVFLGVMADQPTPDAQVLLNFQSDHEMTYPVVRVNPELLQSFDYPENLPTTFVFDRSGHRVDVDHNQRFFHLGAISEERLSKLLDSLI